MNVTDIVISCNFCRKIYTATACHLLCATAAYRWTRANERRKLIFSVNADIRCCCGVCVILPQTRNTFRRTRSLSNATFSVLITWRSSSSKSAAVYKISSKSDALSLRYGDISILKMAAVRYLGIVLPPHETTHEVSVAGRSCLSNFISIWYTDLKIAIWIFCIFGLKCLFRPPKWGLGELWTSKCDYSSSRPPKGTSLRKSCVF